MEKIKQFIDNDFEYFSNLNDSEVEIYDPNDLDKEIVEYLKEKENCRFDYRGICMYYIKDGDEIWVENMDYTY
jgi:hypothetical protein